MTRLIDDILPHDKQIFPNGKIVDEFLASVHDGKPTRPKEELRELMERADKATEEIKDSLRKAVVIVIDNVCEYVYAHTGKLSWHATKDFPCLTPPFNNFWMEMRKPSKFIMTDGKGGTSEGSSKDFGLKRWAFHFIANTIDKSREVIEDGLYEKIVGAYPSEWAQSAFILRADYYWHSDTFKGPLDAMYLLVDAKGQALTEPICTRRGELHEAEFATWHLPPALLAISFMHCKNVVVTENKPDAKLQKARQRRGQKPLVRYRTLNIEPMAKILKREGKSDETGLKKALHVCRGHFSTYTTERPLFGKVSGTFWIPSHIRGSGDEGEVIKDYSVDVPKTA